MNKINVDTSEVRKLAADIARMPRESLVKARPVVQKGALNIKNEMREQASGHPTFPAFPSSITYDTEINASGIEAEIGPDKNKTQGALGNILYFGTSKNGPVLDINGPMEAEAPRFERALGLMAENLLGG